VLNDVGELVGVTYPIFFAIINVDMGEVKVKRAMWLHKVDFMLHML
jgi:hypothetical protein